jgi:TatD family-associated radical SAM protein
LRLHSEPSPSEVIEKIQKAIIKKNWIEIVFCGFGEPTMRLDLVLIVTRWLKKNTNLIIRLNTNGHAFLLNKQRDTVMRLKDAGISKISISLNGHNEEIYKKICRPKFENAYESVLLFIKASSEVLDTEVTAVTIPKINLQILEEKAHEFGASFRKREYLTLFL